MHSKQPKGKPNLTVLSVAILGGIIGAVVLAGFPPQKDRPVTPLLAGVHSGAPAIPQAAPAVVDDPCGVERKLLRVEVDKRAVAEERSGGKLTHVFASGCGFTAEAKRNKEVPLNLSTQCSFLVTSVPRSDGTFEVEVVPEGDCEGVGVEVEVWTTVAKGERPTFAATKELLLKDPASGVYLLAAATSPWRDARIIGQEVFHLPVYLAYQQMQIGYSGGYVQWASTQHWQWAGGAIDSMDVVFQTNGEWPENGWLSYYAYNYVHNYMCGFPSCSAPDVDAWVQPQIRGYGSGSLSCLFWNAWGGNPGFYGIHNHNLCRYI